MLAPKITDAGMLRIQEAQLREMSSGIVHDPGTEALLDEMEQEPGYWEDMAALSEKIWPSKKPVEGQDRTTGAPDTPPVS